MIQFPFFVCSLLVSFLLVVPRRCPETIREDFRTTTTRTTAAAIITSYSLAENRHRQHYTSPSSSCQLWRRQQFMLHSPTTTTTLLGRATTTSTSIFHSFWKVEECQDDDDEDDDDKCFSIDNLDACLPDDIEYDVDFPNDHDEDEECSIDNLDACEPTSASSSSSSKMEANNRNRPPKSSPTTVTLKSFVSQPIVEVQLAALVIVSSFSVGLGTLDSLPPLMTSILKYFELATSIIFTLEYMARWKLADFSPKYLIEPLAIIDLIAILPVFIKVIALTPGLDVPHILYTSGALINLRLLRILRLQRVLVDYETFAKFQRTLGLSQSETRPYQLQLARVVISIFTLLSVTSGLIYSAEHVINPMISDYFTAVYFSLITLTTVGFGDIAPMTNAGRWVVSGSILVGSAVIPAQAAALVEALLDRDNEKQINNGSMGGDTINDDTIKNNKTDENESLALEVAARLDRLEQSMEKTNERIDLILEVLQRQQEPSSSSIQATSQSNATKSPED